MADAGITMKAENGREFTTDEIGYIRGEIKLHLSELIGLDLEGALDLLSERLTGGDVLMDISYKALRVEDGDLVLEVSGDPSMMIENEQDSDSWTCGPAA